MKPKSTLRSFLALAGSTLLAISYAHATPYYWDLDGATPGSGPTATPSGTWSTGGTTWSTDPLGTIATSAYTTTSADDLFFSAGTDATGTYSITLTTEQFAKSLTSDDAGTITISGVDGIINLGGTGDITIRSGSTTIGSASTTKVAGSAGLTKLGAGKLNLSGQAVNTFTGGLNVNSGTLELVFSNFTSGWTDIVNSGNALTFGRGALIVTGENSANNTTQSFNGVTVNAGGGSLLVNPNGAGVSNGATVNLNSLGTLSSWVAGSSLVLGKVLSAGTGTVTLTTTTDKDSTGIYGGRIVFANGTASTGYDWATTSFGSSPYTLEAYTGYDPTLPTNTGSPTTNYGIAVGIILDGNLDANTLKITGSATALALGANTLTLKSGGLLSVGTVAQTISGTAGNKLTAGSGAGGSEDLVIHQYNSATNAGLIISAVIGDNTAGSGNIVNLVKSGIGTVALQGANTYTGNTFINAGTLTLGSPANTSVAGTLGNGSYAGNISIASGAQLAVRSSSSQTLSGVISGDGNLFKGGNGTLTLSDNNTYTGTTGVGPIASGVGGGTLIVTSFNSVFTNVGLGTVHSASSSLGAPTTVANGTITIGAGVSNSGTILKYTGPGETTDRNLSFSFNDDLGHALDASGSGLLKFVGTISSGSGTNASPALTLTGTGSGEFAGVIPNFTTNPLRVVKSGGGTWTLSGANSYTGVTTVSVGKLFVNGDQTSATGAVSVAADATLGGTGTIGGNTTIANNGKLEFNLSTAGGSHDKLELASLKTFAFAGASTLTITSSGGASTGLYTLVTAPGAASITGSVPATVVLPVGWTADPPQIVPDGPNTSLQINITSTGGGGITFADWKNTNGAGLQTLADDHDGDGVDNGTEYFLFGSGSSTGFTALPGVTNNLGTLSVTWTKAASYTGTYGTDFRVETSDTLNGAWSPETLGVNVTILDNDVTYTFPNPLGSKKFARLKVTGP